MDIAIETRKLTKHFGDITAVDHIDLQVWKGEIFGFLGPNGAGKTTTIRMLVGLTTPSEGSARIQGYDIQKEMLHVKQSVGVVPEISNLYNELTVWDNLLFMAGMYHVPKHERKDRITSLLSIFGLDDWSGKKFGGLSKGLKRRATIAAALIHQPDILFLDEPTSGLDVLSARALRQFLKSLRETGVTVFLTTHYIEEADQLCDRIALIVNGRIITVDTPTNLKHTIQDISIVEVIFDSEILVQDYNELSRCGQVEVQKNTVRIHVTDISQSLKAITHFADAHDLEIIEMNTVRPTLEDAFVKLTGIQSEAMLLEKEQRGGGA